FYRASKLWVLGYRRSCPSASRTGGAADPGARMDGLLSASDARRDMCCVSTGRFDRGRRSRAPTARAVHTVPTFVEKRSFLGKESTMRLAGFGLAPWTAPLLIWLTSGSALAEPPSNDRPFFGNDNGGILDVSFTAIPPPPTLDITVNSVGTVNRQTGNAT